MKYRSEIDGLRAVAVLPVIFYHAGFDIFSGGFVGVDVFFVISGYLITTKILSEKEAGQFTITNFYERRARRILPALFFVMFSCVPFAWLWMLPSELLDFSQSLVAVSLFFSNMLFWLETGYFDTASELKPLLHTWSLAIEEQYYIFFPLFIIIAWRFGKRFILKMLVIMIFISISLAHWGAINAPIATFYLLPTRIWELLIGSLTAFYLLYKDRTIFERLVAQPVANQVLSACGLLLILCSIFVFDTRTPFPSLYTLAPTFGTALIILFGSQNTITRDILSNKLFVGIGLISYSAYLWHQPLFAFARIRSINKPSEELIVVLGILSLVLSYITWKFIEKPFRDKRNFNRKWVFKTAIVFSIGFCLMGSVGHYNNGEVGRYSLYKSQILSDFKRLLNERQSLIRFDECHFNNESGRGLDFFLENWDCWDDKESHYLKKIPVIVAGDSHAADIVVSLKLNGYLPLQIGGAGCSLNPDFMTNECLQIFTKLFDEVHDDPYFEYIVLSNHYDKDELTIKSISMTIDYWKKFGLKIIMFTGIPKFNNLEKAVLFQENVIPDFEMIDYSARKELVTYLTKRGVHIIKSEEIFCAITTSCSYRDDNGKLLLVDYGHFSHVGAERFGKILLDYDEVFRSIIKGLNP